MTRDAVPAVQPETASVASLRSAAAANNPATPKGAGTTVDEHHNVDPVADSTYDITDHTSAQAPTAETHNHITPTTTAPGRAIDQELFLASSSTVVNRKALSDTARGIRQRQRRHLRSLTRAAANPASFGNQEPPTSALQLGSHWIHYTLDGAMRTLCPEPPTFGEAQARLLNIFGNHSWVSFNGHSREINPNTPLPRGATTAHLNIKGKGGTGGITSAPELNPKVVFRFISWRDDTNHIGFQMITSAANGTTRIASIHPAGTLAGQIEEQQKLSPHSRFPQAADSLLGMSYGNNRTVNGTKGERFNDLRHETLKDGAVVLWFAHHETLHHISTFNVIPTIISTTNTTYQRTIHNIPPGTTLTQRLGATINTTGSCPAIQLGNHPSGIIQEIEAAEAAGQQYHCRPLKDCDIITGYAEEDPEGADFSAID